MTENSLSDSNQATEKVLSSLTHREAEVLRKRFGLNVKSGISEQECTKPKANPPKDSSGEGGSGAPANIAVSHNSSTPKNTDSKYPLKNKVH